jgi:hypothetical protein
LKDAYSLRFSRRYGRFKSHPVTYVAKRLSRNKLEAIESQAVRDDRGNQPKQPKIPIPAWSGSRWMWPASDLALRRVQSAIDRAEIIVPWSL